MHQSATGLPVDIERQFGIRPGMLGAALAAMVGEVPAGLALRHADGRYLFVNRRLAEMLEQPIQRLLEGRDEDWLDARAAADLRAAELAVLRLGDASTREHTLRIGDRRRVFLVSRRLLPALDGSSADLVCSIWSELPADRHEGDARPPGALAELDGAGPMRTAAGMSEVRDAGFDAQLRREFDLSSREHREFSLVAIAVDDPPAVALPQDGRDQIVQTVARLLKANVRAMDSSFHVGADRFRLLLSGVGLATAHSRVEALRRQCALEPVSIAGATIRISLSIGIASYPHTARDREAIVQAADKALTVAQRRGGNHVALASIPFDSGPL